MADLQDRLSALEEQVAALQTRLTALEEQLSAAVSAGVPMISFQARTAVSPKDREAPTSQEGTIQGTLSYGGTIQLAGRPFHFQQRLPAQSLFEAAPDLLAQMFAALASPHRIIILRTLCEKPCTAQQLQEVLGMGSAGQLYHHLKELLAAGLITQRERSSAYTIEPAKVIPICAALLVAFSLATFPLGTGLDAPPGQADEHAGDT
jgi:ArsR family transcriptional regulator, arsenate/arsenite/antimonite-responsive transcriptional repressor